MDKTPRPLEEVENELAKTSAKLENLRKEFLDFTLRVSHDVQSPVKKILSFTDLLTLKIKGETNDTVREYASRIEKNAAILSQTLRELRERAQKQSSD